MKEIEFSVLEIIFGEAAGLRQREPRLFFLEADSQAVRLGIDWTCTAVHVRYVREEEIEKTGAIWREALWITVLDWSKVCHSCLTVFSFSRLDSLP